MPASQAFTTAYEKYIAAAREARDKNQSEHQRKELFLGFISQTFGVETREIQREQAVNLPLAIVRKRGSLDALFGDLIFEFKRHLDGRDSHLYRDQLRDYLIGLSGTQEYIGLLTDALQFEVYVLDGGELRQTDSFDLETTSADDAFIRLDAYLFSQKQVAPTSADIVGRFGSSSPTFKSAARVLNSMLERMKDTPALQMKQHLWRGLLAKVYGSDIASDELFLRHTYLGQFAKLLAYAALHGIPHNDSMLADIISGTAFNSHGVSNLGEIDFFSWILDDAVKSDTLAMLRRLAASLVVYDLTQINEDLFKQLYQNLVDPETRHNLGEFYTPDWLAELTIQEINYQPGQSLLDPSCGSGTFLFTAIRHLADQGLTGWPLVDFALDSIAGMDVHPLAVTIARINYLLAILPHMHGARSSGKSGLVTLPVYMADTLQTPEESGTHKNTLILPVDADRDERFYVPKDAAEAPAVFTEVIDRMEDYAQYPAAELNSGLSQDFVSLVRDRFSAAQRGMLDVSSTYWGQNLRLLNRLIHEKRDSIWAYMLKNAARPLLLTARKFDVIVGNPPWLTYKDIQDKTYQAEVRDLTLNKYQLLEGTDRKLFTQMELSTLFLVHCEATYLRPGGTIAFVMPRSTITGAKQHRRFQARGITRILDTKDVAPLFNTESCVLIRSGDTHHVEDVPSTRYTGKLPAHEMSLADALSHLTKAPATIRLLGEVTVTERHYYDQFKQGATLVPRNLCFVQPRQQLQPGDAAVNPAMQTDPDMDAEAKKPWKGVRLEGLVYPENLFGTLLSKNLVPFGVRRLHLVALPARLVNGELQAMSEADFLRAGRSDSWRSWFQPAENKWDELKKETSRLENLIDQYNYQAKLISQVPSGSCKVLYNSSGTHISSCVIDTHGTPPRVYEYPTQGFLADAKTYYFDAPTEGEAHYLCAFLNAESVDNAIKPYQTRGIYKGARDIHRTPFEACAIPPFDAADPDHRELARLSQEAHAIIARTTFTGAVYKARSIAREAVAAQLAAIDVVARRVLGL